jgi:hypothetical protein
LVEQTLSPDADARELHRVITASVRELLETARLGPKICPGTLRPRLDTLDAAVLDALEVSVLRPEILARGVTRALARHAEVRAAQPNRPAQLERELAGVRAEIARFVAAIGAGVDLAEIRGALEAAKARAGVLEAESVNGGGSCGGPRSGPGRSCGSSCRTGCGSTGPRRDTGSRVKSLSPAFSLG